MTEESESKGRISDGLSTTINAVNNMINAHNLSAFEKEVVLIVVLEMNGDFGDNFLEYVTTDGDTVKEKIVRDRVEGNE